MWTRDFATGEPICAVCGALQRGRKRCCKTAPYITFEDFVKRYFGDELDLSKYGDRWMAKEFYDDYRLSDFDSLDDYIEATTKAAQENG